MRLFTSNFSIDTGKPLHKPSRVSSRRLTIRVAASSDEIHLSYKTGWLPSLHYSVNNSQDWQVEQLKPTPSSGPWHFAKIPGQTLEFVVTNEHQQEWDKEADGTNYKITKPGRYILENGQIRAANTSPVLIVTDLDDTLIGDDEATAAFRDWWYSEGSPAGSRLIYNTGRALDLFVKLMEEKGHVMPLPDALISSVGTKIYIKNKQGLWEEDPDYSGLLGQGWNLEAVRDACYQTLVNVGKENFHFRPASEMNEFKVTCGVLNEVLPVAKKQIQAVLDKQNVSLKMITSGKGEWRYLDLVPLQAGKKAALEYVRRKLQFSSDATVACGDSGNDIDMLEGEHYGIIVGNAQSDLLEWADGLKNGSGKNLLMVKGHRAYGILEGLETVASKQS